MYIYMVLTLYVFALEPSTGKPHPHWWPDVRTFCSLRERDKWAYFKVFKLQSRTPDFKIYSEMGEGLFCFLTMTLHCWLNIKNKMDGVSMNPDKTPIKCPARSTQPWWSFLNLNHSVHNFWISMLWEDRKEVQWGTSQRKSLCVAIWVMY